VIDLKACAQRGIVVCNVPAASNEAVSQHAFALFMALRRKVVRLHELVVESKMWPEKGTCKSEFDGVPMSWKDEVVGIIGGGELGGRVANIARALGMSVLMAERKGLEGSSVREDRTPFSETLSSCTVLILTCPLTSSTRHMIGEPELRLMRKDSILINVARGPVVVEEALVKALKESWISGVGTDVFVTEPADKTNSALVREGASLPNLVMSPHLAWLAQSSIDKLKSTVAANIEAFAEGKPQNLVVA